MNKIIKIIAYIAIAYFLSEIANSSSREFITKFSENIISILATILAINVPTSIIIVSEILKIQKEYENIDTSKTFKELRYGLMTQIFVLCSLILILCVCDFFYNKNIIDNHEINIISGTFVIASFIYYMEVIYDLGIALFQLMEFNNKDKNDQG